MTPTTRSPEPQRSHQVVELLARALADEDEDLSLAVVQQLLHQVAPDESGRTGDEIGHAVSSQALRRAQPIRPPRPARHVPRRGEARRALDASPKTCGPRLRLDGEPGRQGQAEALDAARRSASIVAWGTLARPSAISSARSSAAPAGTISVTRPIAPASAASTMRPVRMRSSARPMPTMRGRRCVPPSISGTPQRRSGKPSLEPSVDDPQVAPERQLEAAGQRTSRRSPRSSAWTASGG